MAENRGYEPREMRMVTEYIAKYFPNSEHWTRVRLGALHPELLPAELSAAEVRMLTVWKRWADAIVATRTRLILIEGSILPDPGDISKLAVYEALLRYTPEFQAYMDRDIEKQLVIAVEDPLIAKLARDAGIKVVAFAPAWITDYVESLAQRKKRAPLTHPL